MSEENKAIVRDYLEEVWHKGRLDRFEEYIAQDVIPHSSGQGPTDAAAMKESLSTWRKAIPNIHLASDDVIAVDGKVIVRWTITGTHKGELFGIPATGRDIAFSGITIFRLAGGKIAEFWLQGDTLGLMQQLGAIPS
jgi:steroid delta-isomerase-like uncharacterized protein